MAQLIICNHHCLASWRSAVTIAWPSYLHEQTRLRNVRLTCAINRVRIQLHLVASAPFGVVLRETPLHRLILHSNGVAQGSELLQVKSGRSHG